MQLADTLRTYLPFLRRYARALTGSQKIGDIAVKTTLEKLVKDRSQIVDGAAAKEDLYRLFSQTWSAGEATQNDSEHAEQHLQDVASLSRQAFLLNTLEEFSRPQIARILDASEAEVNRLIDEAAQNIGNIAPTRVLIIEDEVLIAMELAQIVSSFGHEVVATVATHKEAVRAAKEHEPGLILADIQLADGSSGIEAISEILESFTVPVVFVTAFPERLLTGERLEPTFLITKPFQANGIRAAISQAISCQAPSDTLTQVA